MKHLLLPFIVGVSSSLVAAPLEIAPLTRTTPVDFEREVAPFLRDNCLSCHCKTTSKGGLNMETPELMLKGGDTGPGVKPGKGAESLVLQAAAHQDDDLKMPPRENKAKAKNLTPPQLALLKLWMDQGAKPSPKSERVIAWQPLPASVNGIFSVAVTPDGQFAACSRANRLAIYHLPSGARIMEELAHRDQINALAATPDGTLLASGAYREVKLWRRAADARKFQLPDAGSVIAVSADGKLLASGKEDGSIALWTLPGAQPAGTVAAGKAPVRALRFSQDGTKLACAAADKTISIWKVADRTSLATATAPAEVAAIAWLGDRLASGGADGVIRVWDAELANPKELAGHKGEVSALDSLGNQLLSGGADGSVRLWDIEKGAAAVQMKHGAAVVAVAIRADGKRMVSAGADNLAKLWDAAGKPVAELRGDRHAQENAAAMERGLQVATGAVAFRKAAIDTTEKQIKTAQERSKKAAEGVVAKKQEAETKAKAVAPAKEAKAAAATALAAADADLKKATDAAALAQKDLAAAKTVVDEQKAKTPPDAAALEKAISELALKTKESEKAKAETARLTPLRKQAEDKLTATTKPLADAEDAAQKAAAAVVVAETEVKLGKEEEQKHTEALTVAKTAFADAEAAQKKSDEQAKAARKAATDAEKPVRTAAFSADGQMLATGGDDQLIHTWSAETGVACDVIRGGASPVLAVSFAPGGIVAAAQDHSVVGWEPSRSWKLERLIGSADGKSPLVDRVESLTFSPDGKFLAIGSGEPSRGGEIKIWDIQSGKFAREFPNIHSDTVLALAFSADGKFLASGAADKIARIIDLASGKVAKSFEGHTHHILGIAWSLDGRTLATAGADNVVKVWDVTTGDRKKNIEGYDKEVTSVRFVGAADQLITSSGDNKVRLVGLDGKELRAFPDVTEFMQASAVTANGKTVVAGGQDGVLRVWSVADGKAAGIFKN